MKTKRNNIDRPVFVLSLVFVLAASVPLLLAPERGLEAVEAAYAFITDRFGFLYIWAGVATLVFLLWLALSRHGKVRLGEPGVRPDFSTFSWVAMLFCAGIGTGVLYWGTIEWAFYYDAPPYGVAARSPDAIEWAASYGMFHWGFIGWAFYCLPAVVIAHTYYVRRIPVMHLSVNCSGVLGRHADGLPGRVIDVLFMVALLGAAGTGVGLSVPLITATVHALTGLPESFGVNVGVVATVTAVFGVSVYLGLERGIKRLSNFNLWATFALMLFVLLAGPTLFIVKMGTSSAGHMLQNFVRMATWTDPVGASGFVESWTVFYWAWWIALAPYMGMFMAKISRGRSIRELVFGMLGFGSLGCALFFAVLGNYALHLELEALLPVTEILQADGAPSAIVAVVASLPVPQIALTLFGIVSLVFMATTYDSVAFTLAMGASRKLEVAEEPARGHRLFWAFTLGILPLALILLDTLRAFQLASVVVSLPLMAIGVMLAVSLAGTLRDYPPRLKRTKR